MEQYCNKEIAFKVSNRNRLFVESTCKSHPWLSFQCVCQTLRISPKTLREAIDGGFVETRQSGKRLELFVSDVFSVCRMFEETFSLFDASQCLGINRIELSTLQSLGVFKRVSKPNNASIPEYRFSKSEIIRFKRKLQGRRHSTSNGGLSLPMLLHKYASLIESPLASVFVGIKSGKISAWHKDDSGLMKSIIVDETSFISWFEINQKYAKGYSIERVSKDLALSSKAVVALIEEGFLKKSLYGPSGIIHIAPEVMTEFEGKYISLKSTAAYLHMGARVTARYLTAHGILPIKLQAKLKATDKVYDRDAINYLFDKLNQIAGIED